MDLSTTGKWAIAVGVVLFVLAIIFSATIPLIGTAFAMVFSWIGWILIIAGITLWIVGRKKAGAPLILKRLSFSRHDIIKSTNWIRLGGAEFRKPIGTSLIVIGVLLLILELVFGLPYPLLFVWIILIAVGAILLIWRPYSIEHEQTKKILIKIPDLLSIHTLHTSLRQCIEDVGYVISENLSPGEGSSSSNFNNNIFLLNGGIKAMKKKISPSKLLVPELADTPIISKILTLFGLGILLTFLGLTLIVHGMTTWEYEDWIFIVQIIGGILMLVGVVILIYDYVTRTSKLARIYVIEEGTAYIPTVNIYDPRILEKPGFKPEPNISVSHTSCELVVTLGATRNRFFDATELENDFKTIMDSVENVIKENMLKSKSVISTPFENEEEGRS